MSPQELIISVPAILLALTIHEFAHGWVAYLCGDSTAKNAGRLTLNPIAHLDPLGTLMMIGTIYTKFIPFGWAKPVPINPINFRNPKRDLILVSFAGPFSNMFLAAISGFSFILLQHTHPFSFAYDLSIFLNLLFQINLSLSLFNLIPIPPLDGSKILIGFLPNRLIPSYLNNSHYMAITFIVLLVLERVADFKTISYVLQPIWNFYYKFWVGIFS